MTTHHEPGLCRDVELIDRYRQLGDESPSTLTDRRIRRYARRQSLTPWFLRPMAIWPLSAAAAVLISVGIFSQMATRTPAPGFPQVRMPGTLEAPQFDPLPAPPAVGHLEGADGLRGATIEASSGSVDLHGGTFDDHRTRLIDAALGAPDQAFQRELEAYRQRWPEAALPTQALARAGLAGIELDGTVPRDEN